MRLIRRWAERVSVSAAANACEFWIWNEDETSREKVVTVYTLSVQNRDDVSSAEVYTELYRTDTVVYVAKLEPCATEYGLDAHIVKDSFRLIQQDWKTGEM